MNSKKLLIYLIHVLIKIKNKFLSEKMAGKQHSP